APFARAGLHVDEVIKPSLLLFLTVGEESQSRQYTPARGLFADPSVFRRDQPRRQAEAGRGDAADLVLRLAVRSAVRSRAVSRQSCFRIALLLKVTEGTAGEIVKKSLVLRREAV